MDTLTHEPKFIDYNVDVYIGHVTPCRSQCLERIINTFVTILKSWPQIQRCLRSSKEPENGDWTFTTSVGKIEGETYERFRDMVGRTRRSQSRETTTLPCRSCQERMEDSSYVTESPWSKTNKFPWITGKHLLNFSVFLQCKSIIDSFEKQSSP